MTKKEKQQLLEVLNNALSQSDRIWKEGEKSHAYIVGCLQGAIKSAIYHIVFMKH